MRKVVDRLALDSPSQRRTCLGAAEVLEEGERDHGEQDVVIEAAPRATLEVIEPEPSLLPVSI
jgi:hypothetical protein